MKRFTEKCPICGKPFEPEASNQRYCSNICSMVGRKITYSIWLDSHPHYFRDRKRLQRSMQKAADKSPEMTV